MECAKRLSQIALALDTSPEQVQAYHIAKKSSPETDASLEEQLAEKEDVIRSQVDYIQFLNHFFDYTKTTLRNYLGESIEHKET